MIRQNTTPQQDANAQEVTYPALFHFRIIADAGAAIEPAIARALTAYHVTAPLTPSRTSSAGSYASYSLSATMPTRDALETFYATVKAIPGVRMLL